MDLRRTERPLALPKTHLPLPLSPITLSRPRAPGSCRDKSNEGVTNWKVAGGWKKRRVCIGGKRPREGRTWQESWTQRHIPVCSPSCHTRSVLPVGCCLRRRVYRGPASLGGHLKELLPTTAPALARALRPREAGSESGAEGGRKLDLCSPIEKRNREPRAHEIPNHISYSEIPRGRIHRIGRGESRDPKR